MKTFTTFLFAAVAAFALSTTLRSQEAAAAKTPLQALQALKAQNDQLIEKQKQSLAKLEELEAQAKQLKIFSKRS